MPGASDELVVLQHDTRERADAAVPAARLRTALEALLVRPSRRARLIPRYEPATLSQEAANRS